MRVAICEWTTFPASFDDELAVYRAAGAGGIGILEFKTAVGPELRSKLRESSLVATNCMPEAGSILPSPLIPGPEAGGFDGWYDVEIFSDNGTFGDAFTDSLWDVETGELGRRAVESMERL
jgi:hypothetical protein